MEEFKKWLTSQKISLEATSCFEESFICFRAGANKASLLFGYLGFMTVLRNRVLFASVPTGLPVGQWNAIQNAIRTEETWDTEVFKTTQQKRPAEIFLISDNLRDQIKFWKDRRNDCAHSKDNLFSSAYVETLYLFVQSNINKFVVNGNKNSVLQRIINHFDPSITPPNQSIEPIIHDLPNAIASAELDTFLKEIFKFFDDSRNQTEVQIGTQSENKLKFINACFQYGSSQLKDSCKNILLGDEDLIYAFARQFPDKCYFLSGSSGSIRRLWHDFLFRTTYADDFPLLSALLRNNLIPDGEIIEMFDCVLGKGSTILPNAIDDVVLNEKGFYECLEKTTLIKMSNFDWANNMRDLIIKYLTLNPITTEMARKIFINCSGDYFPWHLAESLNEFFRINAGKKQEYINITIAHPEIGRPEKIPSLA